MKGTEKIIAHIRADAEAQCGAILAAAQEKCDAIRADFDAQAAAAYAERIRAGVKSCADEGDSAARLDRMEAKKQLLALKQEMISRSFALAEKKLASLPEKEYVALLGKLAANASVSAKTHPCDITVTPDGIYLPPIPSAFNPQLTRGIHQGRTVVLHRPTTLCRLCEPTVFVTVVICDIQI